MCYNFNMIAWDAKEYIEKDRNTWWYVGLFAVGILLAGVAVILNWWTFLVLVIFSVAALLIYAIRPPRVLKYSLDNKGLTEGGQLYKYEEFRAFGVLKEGEHFAIVLIPKKRFGLRVKVYFPEADGEKIVDMFGAFSNLYFWKCW